MNSRSYDKIFYLFWNKKIEFYPSKKGHLLCDNVITSHISNNIIKLLE